MWTIFITVFLREAYLFGRNKWKKVKITQDFSFSADVQYAGEEKQSTPVFLKC